MGPPDGHGSRLQTRIRGSVRTLFLWTLGWLVTTALLAFDSEIAALYVLMSLTFLACVMLGLRRYQ